MPISRDTVYAAIRGEQEFLNDQYIAERAKLGEKAITFADWRVEDFMCRVLGVNDRIGGIVFAQARCDAMREIAGWSMLALQHNGSCPRNEIGSPGVFEEGPLTVLKVQEHIDTERMYQDRLGSDRTDGRGHGTSGYVVMLRHYVNEAVKEWTVNPGDNSCLNSLRKVAGIAVHCLEDCGVNFREPFSV